MSDSPLVEQYGRYRVERELGRGSMGVVFRALDPEIDRTIALKVLRPDRVTDTDLVRRFLREARAAGRLSHPGIVVVYDVGQDRNTVYIAMELVEGEGLDRLIKKGPVPVELAVDLARQVAFALDYAHDQGVVHRDVKPSNIIVAPGNHVKITDFGIARMQDAPISEQTQVGSILGTPAYMSPEQVRGERVDGRSDLFSLGTILFEMVTGENPFRGSNLIEIFKAIGQEDPPRPSTLRPDIPSGLEASILKALAKDPGQRFQSGKEFADALSAALAGPPLRADHGPEAGRGGGPARRPRLFLLFAGVVLAILVAALVLWVRHRPQPSPPEPVSGELTIRSDPGGAGVTVDGRGMGATPVTVTLDPGVHSVGVELQGYYPWEAEVRIEASKTVPIDVVLVREERS